MNRKISLQMFLFLFCFFFTGCTTMGYVLRYDTDINKHMGLVIGETSFKYIEITENPSFFPLDTKSQQSKSQWFTTGDDGIFTIILPPGVYGISGLSVECSSPFTLSISPPLRFEILSNQCTEVGRIIIYYPPSYSPFRELPNFAGKVDLDETPFTIYGIRNKFRNKFPNLYKKFFGNND